MPILMQYRLADDTGDDFEETVNRIAQYEETLSLIDQPASSAEPRPQGSGLSYRSLTVAARRTMRVLFWLTIPIMRLAPPPIAAVCTVFALIAGHSFFKLNNNPGLRAGDSISVQHRGGTTMRTWMRLVPAVLLILCFHIVASLRGRSELTTKKKTFRSSWKN